MQTTFIKSSPNITECPESDLLEFAFVWRSNVGKSSLINMITQNGNLTKISSKPWKTQLINHFLVDDSWFLVDLPGYGYAKVSHKRKEERVYNMFEFITKREQLKYTFLLLDSKLSPQKIDISFVKELYLREIDFVVIFTKIDRTSQKIFHKNFLEWQKVFWEISSKPPLTFKSSSVRWRWRDAILDFIEKVIEQNKDNNEDEE